MKILIIFLLLYNVVYAHNDSYSIEQVKNILISEACGEGPIGLQAVANVIANRVKYYRKTVQEVITQKFQFAKPLKKNCKYEKAAYFYAENLLSLPDITKGALFFQTLNTKKKKWHSKETFRYKNHKFFK